MKRFYPKYTDAKRALREAIADKDHKRKVWDNFESWKIYDLGKQRKVRRYFIGTHLELINI